MRAPPELERFIRQTLGCGCPDSVFESVSITRGPVGAGASDQACWIEVGGRLLIAVCAYRPGLAARLADLFDAAARRRDSAGFNRFRLVVTDAQGEDRIALETAFAPLGARDDRLHLHLVAADAVPPLTLTETEPA